MPQLTCHVRHGTLTNDPFVARCSDEALRHVWAKPLDWAGHRQSEGEAASIECHQSLAGLGQLRSVGLYKLSGDRAGYWAMTINGPYRLVFRFEDGDAHDVEIVNYHRG
jgi:hypothetical protein